MFEAGVSGDNFLAMAITNESSDVAIKTPWSPVTERKTLKNFET